MKKATSTLLAALILSSLIISSMTSCASDGSGETNPEKSGTNSSESSTVNSADAETEAETETEKIQPDIPEMTWDGAAMRFLSREVTDTVVRFYSEISSDEITGDIMNDTVFERTARLESKYNIDISDETSSDVGGVFTKSYLADEQNWDVIVDGFSSVLTQATNGYNADLTKIDYIDLEKPWWDTKVANAMMIGGSLYSAIGAMNTWTDSHTYAVVFNKELAGQFELDPYTLVRENKWTLDTFGSILEQVTHDIDGNGVMDENDRWGAVGEFFNFRIHMLGSDVILIKADENGYPALNIDEKFYTAADRVCTIMSGNNYLLAEEYMDRYGDPWTDVLRKNFRAGNSLFYVGGIEQLLIFRDLDTDIGLLPMMKYDEAQSDYLHSFNSYWSSVIFIPKNSSTTDFTGYILEAMQADSYYSTSVAYYDVVLQGRAMRDKDSCEMLDIIRQSRTIDPEFAYNFLGIDNVYQTALKDKSTGQFASKMKSMEKMADKNIERFIKNYSGDSEE